MLDIVVTGRHVEVPTRMRAYVQDKLAKVEKLCPKALRVDVEVSKERNPRMAEISDRVELTCVSRGPVIRAEAAADDMTAAFDLAWAKLESRLRKSADRRRVHRGSRTPVSVAAATAGLAAAAEATGGSAPSDRNETPATEASYETRVEHRGEGPMLVREKMHHASPMSLDQALYEMELVGHDFFLFADKDSGLPSVVYRRRGYDYGVIRIDTSGADASGEFLSGDSRNGRR
jgi:ribosomal subunit interface protein